MANLFYVDGVLSTSDYVKSLMSIGVVDEDLEIIRDSLTLTLCKPSGEEICILDEAYNRTDTRQFADIDEFEFDIPYYVSGLYKQEKNTHWDLIKGDYLIKLNNEKVFIIDSIEDEGSDKEVKHIHCYSLEFSLGKRNIKQFKGTRQIYRDSLLYSFNGTDWAIYTDSLVANIGSDVYFRVMTQGGVILDTYTYHVTLGNTEFERLDVKCSNLTDGKGMIDVQLVTPDLKIVYSYDDASWSDYEILDVTELKSDLAFKKVELDAINDRLDVIDTNKEHYETQLASAQTDVDNYYAKMKAEEGVDGSTSYETYRSAWESAKSQVTYYEGLIAGIPTQRATEITNRTKKLNEIEVLEAKITGTQLIINPFQTLYLKVVSATSGKVITKYEWTIKSIPLSTPDIFVRSSDLSDGSKALEIKINAETGIGILNLLEQETEWRVGFIDNNVREYTSGGNSYRVYRSFDVTNKSWLDFLKNDFQKAFGCIVTFDTINMLINVYGSKTLGSNRGLYISDENYLKEITKDTDHKEIVTRLSATGNQDITFESVNPTGQDFIEDFSFYTGKDYDNTDYFPKSLLDSLKYYETVTIPSKKPILDTLRTNLNTERENLGKIQNQIATANYELASIQDTIDVCQQTGTDYSTSLTAKTAKESEISTLNSSKTTCENNINNILNQITEVGLSLLKENPVNFSEIDLKILNKFVKEDSWDDETCIDAEELLERSKVHIKEINTPLITFKTDIIDFLNVVESQHDWDKLRLGDFINIFYSKFNIDIEVRLIKITHSIDDNNLEIEFSTKDIIDDPNKYLAGIVSSTTNTSSVISSNKDDWDLIGQNTDIVSTIIASNLNSAKNRVLSGRNQNIDISERGIALREIGDNREQLRMLNNVIAFTSDNWETCSLAITPYGVYAPAVYGKLLAGNELLITNESGSFKVDGNHMVAYNMDLSIENDTNRVLLDPNIGIKLQRRSSTGWKDIMWLDMTGILHTKYMIATSIIIKDDGDNTLLDAGNHMFDIGKFTDILLDGKLNTLEKMQLKSEWIRIQNEYARIILQANSFDDIDRDDEKHMTSALSQYTNAYEALLSYIPSLQLDSEKTTTVDREEFNEKFGNYYDEAVDILNEISDVLRYSSLQLGQMYNTTVIDAINGITVTKTPNPDGTGTPIARTVLNATDGIAIYSLLGGTPIPQFWVDMEGNVNARNLRIFDKDMHTAVNIDENGNIAFDGRLRVWDENWEHIMLEAYRDDNGGKLTINDKNGDLNAYMGSSPSGEYTGGFLKLYEIVSGEPTERIELATYGADHAGTILLNDDSGTKVKISAKDGALNQGVISLFGEDNNSKLILRSRSETDNMSGTAGFDGDRQTGGYIQFNSFDNSHQFFITVNNENNFGFWDKFRSGLEINHTSEYRGVYINQEGGSEIGLRNGEIHFILNLNNDLKKFFVNRALTNEQFRIPVAVLQGSSTFGSTSGRSISHTVGDTNYQVMITPTGVPTGYTGDISYVKTATSFTVYNTGSGTGSFDYIIFV